jgi:PAS domain S-box-containing protein
MRDTKFQYSADLDDYCLIHFVRTHLIAAFTTPDGDVISCTEKFRILFGRQVCFNDFVHPDDLYQDTELKQQLLAGSITRFRVEKRLVDQSSQEHWFDIETSILPTTTGNTEPILAIVLNDITENRKIYDALLWNEKRWRDLVNHSLLLFFQCDDEANLLYFTPRVGQILGIKADEWIERSITDLIHPEDLNEFEQFFSQALHGNSSSLVCRFRTQDAEWVELKLKAQIDNAESGIVLHAQDLSAQFALTGQLQFYRAQYRALLTELSQMFLI